MRLCKLLAAVAVASVVGAASEPIRLQPSSKWDLDYAENSCRLIRVFGDGDRSTKLVFESVGPGDLTMVVAGKPLRTQATGEMARANTRTFLGMPFETSTSGAPAEARFVPGEHGTFTGHAAVGAANNMPAALWEHLGFGDVLQRDDVERKAASARQRPPPKYEVKEAAERAAYERFIASVDAIEVHVKGARPVVLETGPLKRPVDAFQKCTHDILLDFGLNPDEQAKIVRPPWTPNLGQFLDSSIYPHEGLLNGQESSVSVRVLVDASGRVTRCASVSPFNAPAFNRSVCDALTKKAHFEPAELADGTKVPSYAVEHVIFRLQ